jgi:hypothetical protein
MNTAEFRAAGAETAGADKWHSCLQFCGEVAAHVAVAEDGPDDACGRGRPGARSHQ